MGQANETRTRDVRARVRTASSGLKARSVRQSSHPDDAAVENCIRELARLTLDIKQRLQLAH